MTDYEAYCLNEDLLPTGDDNKATEASVDTLVGLLGFLEHRGHSTHTALDVAIGLIDRRWRPLLIDIWMHFHNQKQEWPTVKMVH